MQDSKQKNDSLNPALMCGHTPSGPVKVMRMFVRQQVAMHTSGGLLVSHIRIMILILHSMALFLSGGFGSGEG